jgi:hypothetical protein
MLRNAAKLAYRRGVHTYAHAAPGISRHRLALALGASTTVATYAAWQLYTGSISPKIAMEAARSRMC